MPDDSSKKGQDVSRGWSTGRQSVRNGMRGRASLLRSRRPSVEPLEGRQLLNAGDLDLSFGGGGKATVDINFSGGDADRNMMAAIDGTGRIVLAGSTETGTLVGYDFFVARLRPDGAPDTTFGDGGKAIIAFNIDGFFNNDYASSVAVDSQGRVVVAGYAEVSLGKYDFAVARLNADGSLDTTFGGDGRATVPFAAPGGNDARAYRVAIDGSGRIVLAGTARVNSSGNTDFAVARLNADGSLDTTFSDDGRATIAFDAGGGNKDEVHAAAIDGSGRIVLAGSAQVGAFNHVFAVARLKADGTPDTTFSGDGRATIAFDAGGFSEDDTASGMAIDGSGRIVLAGTATDGLNGDLAVARLNADGSLDTTFSGGGKTLVPFDVDGFFDDDRGASVAIDGMGRIVLAGTAEVAMSTFDFAVARLNADGTLDPTFDGDGKVTIPFNLGGSSDRDDNASSVVIDGSGRIVVAGFARVSAFNDHLAIARILSASTPTPTLTVSTGSLGLGSTTAGTPGSPQTYTLGASDLTGNVAVMAPPGVEVSTDGTTWSSTLAIVPTGGAVAAATIYVRISPGAEAGSIAGSVAITSPGATEQDLAVTGTVTPPAPTSTATSTTLGISPSSPTYGQSVVFTANVAANPSGPTPTGGTVTFMDEATTLGTSPLSAGIATFSISTLTAGTHAIKAIYGGSGLFTGSATPIASSLTVAKASLTITVLPATRIVGHPNPAHPVDYSGDVNGLDLSTFAGALTFTTAATADSPAGTYAVTPAGLSSPNYEISYVGGMLTVVPAPTVIQLDVSSASTTFGQAETFTATVIANPQSATPTGGTVTFKDGPTVLGTSPLVAGVATFSTSSLVAGIHTVTATYSGVAGVFAGSSTPAAATSIINTVAGTRVRADLASPKGLTVDAAGNIFFTDSPNHDIRKIDHVTGAVTIVAGNGAFGYGGDNGPATAAELFNPLDVAVDSAGNLYIADTFNNVIRRVDHATGIISTIAGISDFGVGYAGDDGPATDARLYSPGGIAVDLTENLYIADTFNNVIRKVDLTTGIISTVVGVYKSGVGSYGGDGGFATAAQLYHPSGIRFDTAGNLYIADTGNNVIRRVDHATGIISTIAGTGLGAHGGDGGPAIAATLNNPAAVAVDARGNLYIADTGNNVIRRVDHATGIISRIAGESDGSFGYGGDGGPATAATLKAPQGVAVDALGNLFIADTNNNLIREVTEIPGARSVSVARANLTITADPQTKTAGRANPAFTASFNGFALGQDASVLTGALSLTTTAVTASPAGAYPITPGGLSSANYSINYVNGVLTVLAAPIPGVTVIVGGGSLQLGSTDRGTAGASQSYTLSGANLSSPLTVTAPSGVEVSRDGMSWSTSLSIAPVGGSVAETTILVRIAAGAPAGTVAGGIANASAGAAEQHVAVAGAVAAPAPALSAIAAGGPLDLGSTDEGTAGISRSYILSGTDLTSPLTVTAPSGVEVSRDGTSWSTSLSIAPAGGSVAETTILVRIAAGAPAGAVAGGIANASAGAAEQHVAVAGAVAAPAPGPAPSSNPTPTSSTPPTPSPIPPVTVTSIGIQKVKLGKGKRAKRVTGIAVKYSDAIASQGVGSYLLMQPGRDKKFGTKDDKKVVITSAQFDPATDSVILLPKGGKLAFKPSFTLRIISASVLDAQGRPIDGDGDGQAGSDRTAMLTKGGVSAVANVAPLAVDSLFAGEFAETPAVKHRGRIAGQR